MIRRRGLGFWWMRGRTLWIQYSVRGKRYRESVHSAKESDARALLKKRVAEIEAGKPPAGQMERTTVAALLDILTNDYKMHGLRSLKRVGYSANHLLKYFGETLVVDVTPDTVVRYVLNRQAEGAKPATINRELAALKRSFILGQKFKRVGFVPYIEMLPENNTRQGYVDHANFLELLEVLPGYLKDPISFLYRCGWRVGEMRSLEWRDVDRDLSVIRLRPEKSKNKEGRILTLVGELLDIVTRAREARRLDCPYVFHRDGKQLRDFRHAWEVATAKVGLSGLLVHDLRRSAVRNLRRAGAFEEQAMKITGHRTASVFKRYNITSEDELKGVIVKVDDYLDTQPVEPKVVPIRGEK